MMLVSPASVERLRSLNADVVWHDGNPIASAAQAAIWIRESFMSCWHSFDSGRHESPSSDQVGISLNAIRRTMLNRYPGFVSKDLWHGTVTTDENDELQTREESRSVRRIFRVLVELGDFCYVGSGQYVPRETRIIQVIPGWGRIAGALNISGCGMEDIWMSHGIATSIGRLVRMSPGLECLTRVGRSSLLNAKGEIRCLLDTVPEILGSMVSRTPIPLTDVQFYTCERSKNRIFAMWHHKPEHQGIVLCRSGTNSYFIALPDSSAEFAERYLEIDRDQRKLIGQYFRAKWGASETVVAQKGNGVITIRLRHSLPAAVELEMLAVSSAFEADSEYGWLNTFHFSESAIPFVTELLETIKLGITI